MFDTNNIRITLARHLEESILSSSASSSDVIKRDLELSRYLKHPEALVVTGVRRCGKSTLIKQAVKQYALEKRLLYLNFEDSKLTGFSLTDLQSFYDEFALSCPPYVERILVYDEIQLVPEWERWIAGISSSPGNRIIISGSNSKLLNSELSSLLTGRHRQDE